LGKKTKNKEEKRGKVTSDVENAFSEPGYLISASVFELFIIVFVFKRVCWDLQAKLKEKSN
jgi:hypothetical protein